MKVSQYVRTPGKQYEECHVYKLLVSILMSQQCLVFWWFSSVYMCTLRAVCTCILAPQVYTCLSDSVGEICVHGTVWSCMLAL